MNRKKLILMVEGLLLMFVIIMGSLLLCVFLDIKGIPHTEIAWGILVGATIVLIPTITLEKIKAVK